MMNPATKRILSALGLLLIFSLAVFLRFYGIDWAYKDKVGSFHPDERHCESCVGDLNPYWLSEEEQQLPWDEQWQIFYEKNLKTEGKQLTGGTPGLRPRNYNYGTLSLYLYKGYQSYLSQHMDDNQWVFLAFPDWLSIIALVLALFIGLRLYFNIGNDLNSVRSQTLPWYKDTTRLTYFFPSFLLPLLGLGAAVVLPHLVVNYPNYNPQNMGSIVLIGRTLTAWAGAFTVLLAYLIGRDAYNRWTGLLAALMLATAMLHVQTSHFATVDVLLGFWLTAGVYCFLKLSQRPRIYWYLLGAICAGFAVATKWSGILLPGILFIAHAAAVWKEERTGKTGKWINTAWLALLALFTAHFYLAARAKNFHETLAAFRDFYCNVWMAIALGFLLLALFIVSLIALYYRNVFHGGKAGFWKPAFLLFRPWVCLILALAIGVAAFFAAEPLAYFDAATFADNMAEQSEMHATGERPAVYTQQYMNTPALFYTLDNLFYPSLDWFTALFVFLGMLYTLWRLLYHRNANDLVLAAWVVPSFLLYSTFHSKFPRYLDAILPVMLVFGAKLIVDLASIKPYFYNPSFPTVPMGWKRVFKYAGVAGGTLAVLCGLIYGCSYVGIYNRPHTIVQAANYLKANKAANRPIATQTWDEGLPGIHVDRADQIGIHDRHHQDQNPQQRAAYLAGILTQNDYIVLQSKRGYGTTLQVPDRFPVTNQFLRAFFAEQLGFKVAKVFTNPPRFLGWEFRADTEDETARIYDHPKIIIFEKTKAIPAAELQKLILSPPHWINEITSEEILELQDGYPVYATPASHPLLAWLAIVFILGWMAFIALFPLCGALPDRGYAIAKPVGIAIFSWLCWVLASTHLIPFSRLQAFIVFIALLLAVTAIFARHRQAILAYLKEKWHLLVGLEVLFLTVLAFFLIVRAYHPNAIWGEKPMNYSFINATYRADTFPPEDPWISGHHINYYYYGQAVYSIVGKTIGVPPEYLFNIGGVTVTAMVAVAIFGLAFALCRKTFISLLAAYFAVFAGHIISYLNLIRHETHGDVGLIGFFTGIYHVVKLMLRAIIVYTGASQEFILENVRHMSYDRIFWKSGHDIFPGTAANEFPYWMHLFMDFHAHMLVIPFSLAFLTMLYAYFARPRKETGTGTITGFVLLLSILLGTVICTNTWDLPALMIGLLVIAAVKFFRESDLLVNRKTPVDCLSASTWQSFIAFPLLPALGTLVLSYVLFYPFHYWFDPRVTSIGIMTEGNVQLTTYLGFFGHLLIPLIIACTLIAITNKNKQVTQKRTITFLTAYISIFLLFVIYSWWNPFNFPQPAPYNSGKPGLPMDYTMVGLFLPFLLVMFIHLWQRDRSPNWVFWLLIGFLGLGLSIGIEFFYIKENWSRPSHRWNTIFKFNLQVWHYLSIFAAIAILEVWRYIKTMQSGNKSVLHQVGKVGFVCLITILIAITIPFTVVAPMIVTQTGRALSQDARGPKPTLDGLAWLRAEEYDAYAGIQWFHRFVENTPNIAELYDRPYNEYSRFSTNTGLPALLGWPHHINERKHNDEVPVRRNAVDQIYLSNDKQQVIQHLGRYKIEYLVFGDLELEKRRRRNEALPPYGEESLKRFMQWGDIFQLIYRYGDTHIFRVNKNLNHIHGVETPESADITPLKARQQQTGNNMFTGGEGIMNGAFKEPRGLAHNPNGYFYIADTINHRIQIFHGDGSFAWAIGEEGSGRGKFKEPNDITVDPVSDNIFVADTWNQRVVRLDKNGQFIGAALFDFFGPRGIVFHPGTRLLYITDTGKHMVKVLSMDGAQKGSWGEFGEEDEQFREPVGIDVMPNGNLAVVDSLNTRVKIYSPDGELIRLFPIQTSWDRQGGFESHVAAFPNGNLAVTDPREATIHVYTSEGERLSKIAHSTQGEKLRFPVGIDITNDGRVFVTDHVLRKVLRVR